MHMATRKLSPQGPFLRWSAPWSSGAHQGKFEFRGQLSGRVLQVRCNLVQWSGPQPAFLTGEDYFHSRITLRFVNLRDGREIRERIDTHPIQFALGVRHGRYLMTSEDLWYPPRDGFSAQVELPPGDYQLSIDLGLFDASHLRPLLLEMLTDFRGADPFAEVRIMEYHHQTLLWHAARETKDVSVPLRGRLLRVPRGKSSVAVGAPSPRRRHSPIKLPARRALSLGRSKLLPHLFLGPHLSRGHPCLDAALWVLSGKREAFKRVELRHESFQAKVRKTPWGCWASGDQGDSLRLASETLIDCGSASLLKRWKYLRPHYRIWSTWPYRPAEQRVYWPYEVPRRLARRPWFENRPCGDVELSTTHRLAAAAVASWVCGERWEDEPLKRRGREAIKGWVLPRQELDGFWPYTADRWPGQEGFHCEVVSHLAHLLDFAEWRRSRKLVAAFRRALEFQAERLSLGDGSYLGIPWHSEEVLPGDRDHLGYRAAFTLYAVEAMAAAVRWLGLDLTADISRSVQWLYENFGSAVETGGRPVKRIFAAPLRSLLLMPIQGFEFRGSMAGTASVTYRGE